MTRLTILALLALTPAALAADVYDSPNDDGNPGGVAGVPTNAAPVELNLYINGGPNESAGGDKCTGNGTGDELCGWDLELGVSGGMTIVGFAAAPGIVSNESASSLRANAVNAVNPAAGPKPVGTLTVSSTGDGAVLLLRGLSVGSDLAPELIAATVLASTTVDSDGDGVPDDSDNCTVEANPDQRDTNGDGFGNVCDADLNNDLIVNVIDLGMLKTVFFTADPDADFNGDGIVNVLDLGQMKLAFFNPPGPSGLAGP